MNAAPSGEVFLCLGLIALLKATIVQYCKMPRRLWLPIDVVGIGFSQTVEDRFGFWR